MGEGREDPAGTPGLRLGPDDLPVTWIAGLFSLLVGATMLFVPYEFEAGLFRSLYPSIRIMGLGFLAAGLGLLFGAAWGRRGAARWADVAARLLFLAVLGMLWWQVSVRPGPLSGALAYPLLMLGVVMELAPAFARGGLWRGFVSLLAFALAATMWIRPGDFPGRQFGPLVDALVPLGALSLAMGFGFVLLRRRFAAERWIYLGFAGLMGYLAVCLGRRGSWAGMELYLVIGVGSLLVAIAPPTPRVATLNTKLLRGMVAAGLLPLIAVGGLASFFAQRELEATLREDILRATVSDAEAIGRELGRVRGRLVEAAARPAVLEAVARRDARGLQGVLERLREDEPLLEHVFVQDPTGQRWVATGGQALGRNFAHRDYHRRVIDREEVHISAPYAPASGGPVVVVAAPIKGNATASRMGSGVVHGVLGGVVSLRLVGAIEGTGSSAYRVRLVDRRDRRVLRDSGGGVLLEEAQLPADLVARAYRQQPGALETLAEEDRRLLVGHAPVPGSDWVVLASQDVASAYRPLTRVSAVVGASVVLAGLLAGLLARTLARHFSSRIGGVTGAAQALAEGDLGRRAAPGDDPDEVGTLARVFNQMAERLQRGQNQLASMNEELRSALEARGQLMEALRRADRRKDEFLAMLAHELRNPLAALSGSLEAMNRRPERDPDALRLGEIGRRQIRHLARMVDDLLDVSRITSNKITLRRERHDLRRPLLAALDTTRPLAEARGQTLHVTLPPAPLLVDGDLTRLEQVFSNLLDNAVKYTDQGGRISVVLQRSTGELGAPQARLVVSDNGRGIAASLLPNIFDLFVQGEITIDRSEGGLGLGLTLVRRLVHMHEGRVEAASAGPGQGSTFVVALPALPLAPGAEVQAADAGGGSPLQTPSGGRRIVLVDDNEDALLSLKDFLETCGHAVGVAHDGLAGRDLILHERPHVAFVDLGLPKLDGFEVARQVRSAGVGAATRLVALTGYGDPETRQRAVEAGFDAHVVKPVEISELERLLA